MTFLGIYFAPEHSRQADRDYIQKLQPPVIRILDPDVQQIATVHALAPNAIIMPRLWSIDDNNGQAVRDLMADPIGTGKRHADQYRAQFIQWQSEALQRGLPFPPTARILFNAANEPNQGGTPDKIAAYNVAFLEMCRINGIRAAALCLGVGWPDNTGPDTPVNWQPYANAGLFDAIARGQHWLELHEYFYKSGPQDGWRWLAGRHLQCPFDVPILLGEIGIDNFVDAQRWQREGGNRGWQGNVSPDVYAEMIEYHIRNSDRRVVAALPFITDYRSNAWESFDTAQAHNALLARKDRMIPQAAPPTHQPFETHLPNIVSEGPTPAQPATVAYVAVVSGANIRNAPIDGAILIAAPYGAQVGIVGVSDIDGWLRVRYGNHEGWMSASLVTLAEPTPQPVDNWQRSIEFVLKQEGGLSIDPNDPGNYVNGVFVGTKFGISANAHPNVDIVNLTVEQAKDIYRQSYWGPSGASALPWPLCLAVMDLAVNGGVGTAQRALKEAGHDFVRFMAWRLRWYCSIDNFERYGRAWIKRCSELMMEAAK